MRHLAAVLIRSQIRQVLAERAADRGPISTVYPAPQQTADAEPLLHHKMPSAGAGVAVLTDGVMRPFRLERV